MEVIIREMMMKVIKITIILMEVMIGEIIKVMKIMITIMHYTVNNDSKENEELSTDEY